MKRPEQRFEFSAMPQRKKLSLPEGKRMAVYCLVNIENWDIEKPIAREYVTSPAGVVTVPNIPNWSWHEYGMRVGIWRMMDFFDKHNLKVGAATNASVLSGHGEPVAAAMRERGWEFIGHGAHQAALHIVNNQQENIRQSFEALKAYTGVEPKGWLGPGLHETLDTLDYLSEEGFKYVCDFPMDEHPVEMKTTAGSIMAMPYSMETSELPMMVVAGHESHVWYDRVVDQFDMLYEESADNPRVMSLSVHPYIMGVPHRFKHFKKAYGFCTPGELHDWWASQQD
jgi:peptidoglycan/xylan/chitin deacetylase (PgdA/CDA1 family)